MIPTADEVRDMFNVGDEVFIEGSSKLHDGLYKIESIDYDDEIFPIYLERGYFARLKHINLAKSFKDTLIGGE